MPIFHACPSRFVPYRADISSCINQPGPQACRFSRLGCPVKRIFLSNSAQIQLHSPDLKKDTVPADLNLFIIDQARCFFLFRCGRNSCVCMAHTP
jgi:hypothetical protein